MKWAREGESGTEGLTSCWQGKTPVCLVKQALEVSQLLLLVFSSVHCAACFTLQAEASFGISSDSCDAYQCPHELLSIQK